MKMNENNAGLKAEQLAENYLKAQGLKLVTHNFHCRFGEIDLIMLDANVLVFAEVRLRSNLKFGSAAASITRTKQQKLTHTAEFYLQQYPHKYACRFDAVLMHKADKNDIIWLKNIFDS